MPRISHIFFPSFSSMCRIECYTCALARVCVCSRCECQHTHAIIENWSSDVRPKRSMQEIWLQLTGGFNWIPDFFSLYPHKATRTAHDVAQHKSTTFTHTCYKWSNDFTRVKRFYFFGWIFDVRSENEHLPPNVSPKRFFAPLQGAALKMV